MKKTPIIAVDFDNTIVDWIDSDQCILKDGARQALITLKSKGCFIIIHTCRIGIAKRNGAIDAEVEIIRAVLERNDIPFDSIHMGSKVIADAYIDDRAVAFRDDWSQTCQETLKLVF